MKSSAKVLKGRKPNRTLKYVGTKLSLKSGEMYTFEQLAKAINTSKRTIQSRFYQRNVTTVVTDDDMYPVGMNRTPRDRRLIEYQGNHPDLVDGNKYTYSQLTKVFGLTDQTIRDRMRGYMAFTDSMVESRDPNIDPFSRLETKVMKFSDRFLRKKLV